MFTEDSDIISDCLWTISYIADTSDDEIIDYVSQGDTIARLIDQLSATDITLYVPALRSVGNILTTNDQRVIERCIWHGVIDKLTAILFQSNSNLIKECLWALSNITAGP